MVASGAGASPAASGKLKSFNQVVLCVKRKSRADDSATVSGELRHAENLRKQLLPVRRVVEDLGVGTEIRFVGHVAADIGPARRSGPTELVG